MKMLKNDLIFALRLALKSASDNYPQESTVADEWRNLIELLVASHHNEIELRFVRQEGTHPFAFSFAPDPKLLGMIQGLENLAPQE